MSARRKVTLVLIGPPGSGKGTQAAKINQRYGIPVISTGDILRAAVKAGTPMGVAVQTTLSSGGLVGDDMMIGLVRDRLAQPDTKAGFVLDGFPRTIVQADALSEMASCEHMSALVLDVPDRELERRLTSRRICSKCKTLYTSRSLYGSEEELCSKCGSVLITRDDDNIETIRHRLRTYRMATEPLIDYYRRRGELHVVDGTRQPDEVTAAIFKILGAGGPKKASK